LDSPTWNPIALFIELIRIIQETKVVLKTKETQGISWTIHKIKYKRNRAWPLVNLPFALQKNDVHHRGQFANGAAKS
jgi:hypothetical protein